MKINASPHKKWWILFATALSCILVGIDYTIVNTCLPNIQQQFHISINQLQWIITGFGLTFSTLLIAMGRLSDLFGHRKMLYIGIIGFTVSSLIAGLAQSGWELISMRFFQGIFGAMLFPCGISLVSAAFPSNEQGRALGIFGSLLGLGMAIGPVLGGVLTHFLSWRWIFFINIPIAMCSLLLCALFISESSLREKVKIDWIGAILLITCLISLILAVTKGLEWGWTSPPILSLFTFALISLLFFIHTENKVSMPLIPFHLMKSYPFFLGNLIFIASVSFSWVVVFLAPLYLQNIHHYSSYATGLILIFMTAMVAIMPVISGHWLDKKGHKRMTYWQFIISIVAFTLFLTLHSNSNIVWIIIALIFAGCAWGMGNGLGMPIALSGLKGPNNAGLLSGATTTILNVFAVLSLSIGTVIFRYGETKAAIIQPPQQAFMHGFHMTFLFLLIATLALAGCTQFILNRIP